MAGWAFALMVIYLALAFGVRVGVALRTTGSTGIVLAANRSALEVLGGALFGTALVGGGINPPLALDGAIATIPDLDTTALHAAGFVLAGIGIAGTFASQLAMGDAWRIGVDRDEATDLVTEGVFSRVRNPIYTFMVIAWTGFALLVPTWLSLASVPVGTAGIWIQVRFVEEPHLLAIHGEAFRAYAARVGRFIPGIGKVHPRGQTP